VLVGSRLLKRERSTWVAIAALDTTAPTAVVYVSLPFTNEPHAVADLQLALCVLVVLVAVLALDARAVIATAVLAFLAAELLMEATQEGIAERVSAAVVLGIAGAVAWVATQRILSLVGRATRTQHARQRLSRYFSPAVAERIVETGTDVEGGEHRDVT